MLSCLDVAAIKIKFISKKSNADSQLSLILIFMTLAMHCKSYWIVINAYTRICFLFTCRESGNWINYMF